MKILTMKLLLLSLLAASSSAAYPLHEFVRPSDSNLYVFVNVSVIPMDKERVVEHQNVVVRDGTIERIGDFRKVVVPQGAIVIDGRGMYLIPGLADMHAHLHSMSDLLLWIVNGVTTIRNMRGTPLHLAWRQRIESREMIGPNLYSTGAILEGSPPSGENLTLVETEAKAETLIEQQKRAGFDFVKVYTRLSPSLYSAITQSAKRHGMRVVGHVPSAVGLNGVLSAGQASIEHLTGYMSALKIGNRVDQNRIQRLAEATQKAGVWNCPTLIVQQRMIDAQDPTRLLSYPEMQYVSPLRIALWKPTRDTRFLAMQREDFEAAGRGIEVLKKLTRALQRSGAGILLGTDAPSRFVVPGYSVHQELQNLVAAGLSPFQALQSATTSAATFLNASRKFGSVAERKQADLILLKANPLKNIRNTTKIAGVMVRGHWISQVHIAHILKTVRSYYNIPQDVFAGFPALPQNASSARYKISYNDATIGEERVSVISTKDSQQIIAQQVTYPPFDSRYQIKLEKRSGVQVILESERPEGNGKVKIIVDDEKFRLVSDLPYQQEMKHIETERVELVLLAGSVLSIFNLPLEKLTQLKIGETVELSLKELVYGVFSNQAFELQDTVWKIKREAQIGTYSAQISSDRQTKHCKFQLDENGLPVIVERGQRTFERVAIVRSVPEEELLRDHP